MTFSSTADHIQSGTDLITESLEMIGVLSEGESPSADQSTSALRTLNNLIKLWSADTQIYAQGEYTLDLVASTASYDLGVSNVGYIPQKVINATLINSSTDYERTLTRLTQEEWYALGDRTTESTPTQYFFKRNAVGVDSTLYVWPVPEDTTYDINLWLQYPIRDVDTASDDVYFTAEWYLALSFELASILGRKYGVSLQECREFHTLAEEYRWEASTYDTDGSVYFQPERRR